MQSGRISNNHVIVSWQDWKICMHELSIAQNIVDVVKQNVPEEQRNAVRSVKLKIGCLSGILPDSLQFCFEAMISSTSLEKAALDIESIPIQAVCSDCNNSFQVEDPVFVCTHCGGTAVQVIAGAELQIVEIVLDDPTEEA